MSNNYYKKHKDEFYPKYSKKELIECAEKFQNGGKVLTKIFTHFFRRVMWQCRKNDHVKYTPHQFINEDSLIKIAKKEFKKHPNFYHDGTEIGNIIKFMINQHTYTKTVTQFPIKVAKQIYETYGDKLNKDYDKINVFDSSCGFGSRMSAALLLGFNYYGIDPNHKLQVQLQKLVKFYRDNDLITKKQKCVLAETGSEIYYPQLKNKMDIAFTSPPYFCMEMYANDKYASTQNYNDYQNWLDNFLEPTIKNTYKYLKKGGYFLMNIRNSVAYGNMLDDTIKICKSIKGWKRVRCNIKVDCCAKAWAKNVTGNFSNVESVICFQKI